MRNQPFYAKYVKSRYDLPGTDFLNDNSFNFGNYPELSEVDIQTLCIAASECNTLSPSSF